MSEYPPGTFQFAERSMDLSVQEAMREARSRRLQREASAGRESNHRFYFSVLAWVGQRLTTWGERLQERYSTEESVPLPQVG